MTDSDKPTAPYTVLALCFTDRARGAEVLKQLKADKVLDAPQVVAHALVEVDDHGKTQLHQHGRGGVGASAGIVAGEALALLGGPVGLLAMAVAGGAIGGAVGHFVDRAFSKEDLARLKDHLLPNSSAILTTAKDTETARLTSAGQALGAAVVTLIVEDEAANEALKADDQTSAGTTA